MRAPSPPPSTSALPLDPINDPRKVHWDLQRATLRAAEEERHRVQLELGDRRQSVEKLRAKYETLAKSFAGAGAGGCDGGDGGAGGSSQAYFIIAAAQKREELQREGDELDQEIRRCEREIRALESTLRHLNARNVDFRVSFQRADPASRDADALKNLEARAKAAQDGLFRRKKELQRAQTDHEEDIARLYGAKARATRIEEQNTQLEAVRVEADAQLEAQREALGKAAARLADYRASHRNASLAGNADTVKGSDASSGAGKGIGAGDETIVPTDVTPAPVAGGGMATVKIGGGGGGDSDGVGGVADAPPVERGGETLTEKALRASTIRDTASGVLYTLGQLAREFPEMHDALNTCLHKGRLKIPPAPPAHGPARAAGGGSNGVGERRARGGSARVSASRGSEHSTKSGASVRSSRSGGGMRGGSLGDRRSSRGGGGIGGDVISPMRVFEAPM